MYPIIQKKKDPKIQGFLQKKLIGEIKLSDLNNYNIDKSYHQQQSIIDQKPQILDKVKVNFNRPTFTTKNLPTNTLYFQINELPNVDNNFEKYIHQKNQAKIDFYDFILDFEQNLKIEDVDQKKKKNAVEDDEVGIFEGKINAPRIQDNGELNLRNLNSKQNQRDQQNKNDQRGNNLYSQFKQGDQSQLYNNGNYFYNLGNNQNNQNQSVINQQNGFNPKYNDIMSSQVMTEALKLQQETGLSLEESSEYLIIYGSYDNALKNYIKNVQDLD